MGKSSLCANIAFDVARHYAWEPLPDGTRRKTAGGGIVAFFALEMSAAQMAMRLLAEVGGVSSDKIRRGEITAVEFGRIRDASNDIQESPLYIDDTGGISISKMAARARRLKRSVGLDLIVVDYLQLMTVGGGARVENRVQEVSQITQGLKALAKELNVPVIGAAQLSRQVENREDKRPQLADLRESGSIEQDSDVVMSICRESYYLRRARSPRRAPPSTGLAGADGPVGQCRRDHHRQAASRPHQHGEAALRRTSPSSPTWPAATGTNSGRPSVACDGPRRA